MTIRSVWPGSTREAWWHAGEYTVHSNAAAKEGWRRVSTRGVARSPVVVAADAHLHEESGDVVVFLGLRDAGDVPAVLFECRDEA